MEQNTILSAEPTYVRYKPRTNCLVSYRCRVADTGMDAAEEILFCAKVYGADAPAKIKKAHERERVPGHFGPGRVTLREFGAVVSFFPNDDDLKTLLWLSGPEPRRKFLKRLLPGLPGLWSEKLRTLRYKPERRYVARLSEESSNGKALVKIYARSGYRAARRSAEALERTFEPRGPLRLAPLLGGSDRYGALAFGWVPGRPLDEVLLDPESGVEGACDAGYAVGAALAGLHGQDPRGLGYRSWEQEADALIRVAKGVESVAPGLGPRARELAQGLADLLSRFPSGGAPIHGDFDAGQVLLAADGVFLLDLDRTVRGDPAEDLGTFAAQLEREVLGGELAMAKARAVEATLLEGYLGSLPGTEGSRLADRMRVYGAAGLLKLAPEPFRYRSANWLEDTERILARAGELLEQIPASVSGT